MKAHIEALSVTRWFLIENTNELLDRSTDVETAVFEEPNVKETNWGGDLMVGIENDTRTDEEIIKSLLQRIEAIPEEGQGND